jgi:hypothetical protein
MVRKDGVEELAQSPFLLNAAVQRCNGGRRREEGEGTKEEEKRGMGRIRSTCGYFVRAREHGTAAARMMNSC